MSIRDENKIKGLLSGEFGEIVLSEPSKKRIKANMAEMLERRRHPLPGRLIAGFREFWHSTYEISMAPAALSAAVALSLLIFTLYPGTMLHTKPIKGETIYIQSIIEHNGTQSVVYRPVHMEVNGNANN